jgi:uncharacterized protein YfaS (alpha-2-macroglobulin family)
VVLETTTIPPPDTWIAVDVDAAMPSPDGPERHAAQRSELRLEPTFFIEENRCATPCDPEGRSDIQFRRGIDFDALAPALTVRNLTRGGAVVARSDSASSRRGTYRAPDGYTSLAIADAGYMQPPATTWQLELDETLTAVDGQTLGYRWIGVSETMHARAVAVFTGSLWEANARGGRGTALIIARNVERAGLFVEPAGEADVIPRLLELRNPRSLVSRSMPRSLTLPLTPDAVQAHGIDLTSALEDGRGFAWVGVRPQSTLSGAVTDRSPATSATLLQVTNLGVSVKDSPQGTLVFVTRIDNAAPVDGARVAIIDRANTERWRGTTDRDGVVMAPAMPLRSPQNVWDLSYVVIAEKDGDRAYVASTATSDVTPWAFGARYDLAEAGDVLRASIFTDRGNRGIYRQGDELRAKVILRNDSPSGTRMADAGATLQVLVRDRNGREVDRRSLPLGVASAADWSWRVPDDGALGHYSISVGLASDAGDLATRPSHRRVTGSFLVAAFRRPDFRVDASVHAAVPILGSPLAARLEARYLFGAPIGRQPVRWWVSRTPAQRVPDAIRQRFSERQFAFGYLPRQEPGVPWTTRVVEKTEPLAADGSIAPTVPTDAGADAAYSFSFEGDVEGVSGQHIANRDAVTLHPASFYVGLERPSMFFDVRKGGSIRVIAVDLDGRPRAGVPVTLSIVREVWEQAKPINPIRVMSAPWERREETVGQWRVTTTEAGAPFAIPLREGGCYILRAVARDADGRPTRTEVTFYAIGPGRSFWRTDGNRITLTPERRTWLPGETARILVQSPWERATALVTVEREGIRSHRRVDIASTQDTIDVPITDRDIPNVFVSVLLVKGRTSNDPGPDQSDPGRPAFRVGYTELTVDDASKRLRVEVTADRAEYRPRDEVRVSVVVEPPSVPSLSSVSSLSSVPSSVTLWAMDHGLLSLTDYQAPDVARAIYAHKALQVMTVDNRAGLIERRVLASAQQGQQGQLGFGGGGGGRGGALGGVAGGIPAPAALAESFAARATVDFLSAAAVEQPVDQAADIRTDFRPLVFWLGSLTTDASGRATTTVTLPDSLTTYRIMAVAADAASRFGAGDAEIRTAKPLTMLPAFPRFLAAGDRASFGAVVTNNTRDGGDAVVTIRSLDADVLQLASETSRTIRLAPGESAPVRFDALARAMGAARVQMRITMGSETDAFEMSLPIVVPATLETVAAYGDTLGRATERLSIPSGIVPRAGGLTVSLASTALVGLEGSARYLQEYGYQCAEQKASRALALLLSADLGGAFQLAGATPAADREAATGLLNDLYGFQCGDGGFALWPGQCQATSAYLTAYILHVLKTAQTLQVHLDQNAVDRALGYLQRHLRQPPPEVQWWPAWAASQTFAVKVLTEFGRNQNADLTRLHAVVESMPTFALSYLADAMRASGDRGTRYQDVIRRISNRLAIDADRAHVEEVDDVSLAWLWNTNVRATAVVLGGLARRGDDQTYLAPLARWLLAARQNGRWGTTQENAVALDALVAFYRAFEADVPNLQAEVGVAGRVVGTATFAGRSTTAEQFRIAMPDLVRQVGAAPTPELTVSRTGTGRLYYTARMQYLVPEPPAPVTRGIRLDRRFERVDEPGASTTSFSTGDIVRVTVTVTVPHEGRYLAITDPVAAGFEPIDGTLKTTASDLGRVATTQSSGGDWRAWWRRGGFDHVEKHDDRVIAFATRLSAGRHEFSYLVRATTAGSFSVAGPRGEAMYAPEISGRGPAGTIRIR